MSPERLLEYFEHIIEAPEAAPRLRRFVLDLAVRGKLVERIPEDEPATELLKRIASAKDRSAGDAKIGKQEPVPAISLAEMPFEVPRHWAWLPLTEIGVLSGGMTPSKNRPDFWGGDINWFSPKDIKSDEIVDSELKITAKGLKETALQLFPPGCLFMVARSGILKRTFPVSINRIEATANQDLKILSPFVDGLERYLQIMFRGMTDFILSSLVKTGTTVQSLKYEEFELQLLPLPPLAEQHRIVAKVDELMALCDELEAARAQRETRRDRLVAATLHGVNNGDSNPEPGERSNFEESARFYFNHLSRLTTRPEHIHQLRQTILNLAVRGKLIPQDPEDEPIHTTLRRIIEHREKLVRTKKARHKRIHDCVDLARRDDLPESWAVERLGNLVDPENTISYGVLVPGNDVEHGIPFVRAQDLSLSSHPDRPNKTISVDIEKPYARTRLRGGEILLCVVGSIGKLGVVPPSWAGANIARAVARIRPVPDICRDYLLVVLRGQPVQTYFLEATRTLAQPTLNVGLIEQTPIPLPPLAEQHRIVAKVDELMALCDELESRLTATANARRQLLEATLAEAFAQ